jgi:hypothetical protein
MQHIVPGSARGRIMARFPEKEMLFGMPYEPFHFGNEISRVRGNEPGDANLDLIFWPAFGTHNHASA